jgi:hypothetical protein
MEAVHQSTWIVWNVMVDMVVCEGRENEGRENVCICKWNIHLYTEEDISIQFTNYCILKYEFKNYTVYMTKN